MKKYKAVIFDLGNVLTLEQNREIVWRICQELNVSKEELRISYRKYRRDYDKGILTGSDYWLKIARDLNTTISLKQARELLLLDHQSWSSINEPMLDLIRKLKKENIKIGLISNLSKELSNHFKKNFAWLSLFDVLVFSCHLKILKPDPDIYLYCLKKLRLKAKDCLFTDDIEDNVVGAGRIGLKAIHFTGYEAFVKTYQKLMT